MFNYFYILFNGVCGVCDVYLMMYVYVDVGVGAYGGVGFCIFMCFQYVIK